MVKFRAGDILVMDLKINDYYAEIEVVLVKAHEYTLKAHNYEAAQKTWDLEHHYVHKHFRKLTKLDKALK